ncbi:MAG TPA: AEC family transporter [Propionibacterium sp.]|nr:AEC family transporter [Propionibacterium sp.]
MDLTTIASALVPTALLIGFGAALRRLGGFGEPFWTGVEGLTYNFLLPALFIVTLARADFGSVQVGLMALVLAATTLVGASVTTLLRRVASHDGPAFTSVFQGAIRFNNYVGLVIASALFGQQGVALAAFANAVLVPIVNVLSTFVLAKHGHAEMRGLRVLKAIATNPLVVSCLIGLGLNLLREPTAALPAGPVPAAVLGVAASTLSILGQAALPIGLLCVGSGLQRPEGGRQARSITVSTVLRLLVMPATALALVHLTGLRGDAAVVSLVFLSLPTASSAYVLARRLGGDAPLMASITAVQTGIALLTVPVWMLLGQAYA